MTRRWSDPAHPLHLVLGLMVWAVWFVVLYAGLSVACEVAPPAPDRGALTMVNGTILAGGLVVAALLSWCARRVWRARNGVAAALYAVAAVASLAVALPGAVLPPCV